MKTLTLDRYPIFGRSGFMVHAMHYGTSVHAHMHCQKQETIVKLLVFARHEGFTHVKFIGDWEGITVRKTMRTRSGLERVAERILLGEHPTIDFEALAGELGLDTSFVWTPEILAPYLKA